MRRDAASRQTLPTYRTSVPPEFTGAHVTGSARTYIRGVHARTRPAKRRAMKQLPRKLRTRIIVIIALAG